MKYLFSILLMFSSQPDLNLIPWPQRIETETGLFTLTEESRIRVSHDELLSLARVLCEEIHLAFGLRLEVNKGPANEGDILLGKDPSLRGEAYRLEIKDKAAVLGGRYQGVAMGTATMLQSLFKRKGAWTLPRMIIDDTPHASYRGLLVDVARQRHSVDTLKQIIVLCRFYKIRYLQLHLTDDQSFTFPSASFPELATPDRHYTLEELKDLVRFADARGVTLIPEFDVPGHTAAMRAAMPELFDAIDPNTGKAKNLSVLNLGKKEIYPALDTLINEMCAIFTSSPYFHIGADEAWLGNLDKVPETAEAIERLRLDDAHDLFLGFIVKMHESVKRRGKKTLMWESFRGTGSRQVRIPKDIIVFAWETAYELPQNLLGNGYKIINASWKPAYVTPGARWSPETIYGWNMYRWENWWRVAPSFSPIQLEERDEVIGAQMCSWEMHERDQIPELRKRLPAMGERIWNPDAKMSYRRFQERLEKTDGLLEKLIRPVKVDVRKPRNVFYIETGPAGAAQFGRTATLHMAPTVEGGEIHYTLDGTTPDKNSPVYVEPITLEETTVVKVRVFGEDGEPKGFTWWRRFEHRPITVFPDGLITHVERERFWEPPDRFGDSMTLSMISALEDGRIRYTLDGKDPTPESITYKLPITLDGTTTVKARFFGDEGRGRGETWQRTFRQVDFQRNLTFGKPVSASGENPAYPPEAAVDGVVDLDRYWDASKGPPQWLQVDLEAIHEIDRIHVYPYWDGRRYYQYVVEVSEEGDAWTRVVDMRENVKPSSAEGYRHWIDPVKARYIRVTMLKNSANIGVHLVEVRVFEKP